MLSRSIATSDQLMLGLHICKFAYPQKVPDKVCYVKKLQLQLQLHSTKYICSWLGMGIIHHEFYVERRYTSLHAVMDKERATFKNIMSYDKLSRIL